MLRPENSLAVAFAKRSPIARGFALMLAGWLMIPVGMAIPVGLATADERPERDAKPGRLQGDRAPGAGMAEMLKRLPLMRTLDADGDGTLSKVEIEGAVAALKKLDQNRDGSLDAAELSPRLGGRLGPNDQVGDGERRRRITPEMQGRRGGIGMQPRAAVERMFDSLDADGDGKLSGDEVPERMRRGLMRIDENGNGSIEKSELEQLTDRVRDRERGDQPGGRGVKPKRPSANE